MYSTPACYLKALSEVEFEWTTKDDDFFPYASDAHSYWTGFFTSRPNSKRLVRDASKWLQLAKQMASKALIQNKTEVSYLI